MYRFCRLRGRMQSSFAIGSKRWKSSVIKEDTETFGKLSSQWTKETGVFKALHSMNRLRIAWILQSISSIGEGFGANQGLIEEPLANKRIVDVGCGGGILSLPLARLGADVSAIDASEEVIQNTALKVDRMLKRNAGCGNITFECCAPEKFALNNAESYDAVIASEILEHVADLELFVDSCVKLARKGALLFFTTINKTFASRILAVWAAEELLGVVPSGVHDWSKFVPPTALQRLVERNGCSVRMLLGMAYNPFTNRWSWIQSTSVNYALLAIKH